jgi:hypothetical protein
LLSLDQWERILAHTDEQLGGRERIYASHDEIGSYLRSKDHCWLADVRRGRSGVALSRQPSSEGSFFETEFAPEIASAILDQSMSVPSLTLPAKDYVRSLQRVATDIA